MGIIPAQVVAMALLLWPAVAPGSQEGSFFDPPLQQRSRATFAHADRERLLAEAYACNRASASGEQREQCLLRERAAQQAITDRTRSNHRQAESALQELRRMHDINSASK